MPRGKGWLQYRPAGEAGEDGPHGGTRFAVVSFVQRGSRMIAEDVHYLDTVEQGRVVAKFIAARRPGVLLLSVSPSLEDEDPEIVVLEQIGAGLASATATVH
ncbi:MAG: hypothetical protein JNK84_06045 [Phreatobacter sp.]|uniref:hypothetical protein n=1 Tax=Phreatobacter sp. TaxID=1966341 RepID=UPI001A4E2A7D|nr:hypothetical protein [Phreatobacter sp.]MBL8568629.1 hypothetical protein [Phreatobacter sp.]